MYVQKLGIFTANLGMHVMLSLAKKRVIFWPQNGQVP